MPGGASESSPRCPQRVSVPRCGGVVPSRTRILAALRAAAPPAVSLLPDLPAAGQRFDDPAAHFAKVLQNVGGRCERLPGMDAVKAAVAILPVVLQASKVASLV